MLPRAVVSAVCRVPGGAFPSAALGHYERDTSFYREWDVISRSASSFTSWMDLHVLMTADFDAFRATLATSRVPAGSERRRRPAPVMSP
jgi:glutaconate CoA-transferase subunit A